jgi:very-short-patch-repair endonuclease
MKPREEAKNGRPRLKISSPMRGRTVKAARDLRADATPSEGLLWVALRNRQLDGRKFRRQQPMGPFVLDFYCAAERLAVEIDGSIHNSVEQHRADAERQQLLEDLDIRVLRVSASTVERNLAQALEAIRREFTKE